MFSLEQFCRWNGVAGLGSECASWLQGWAGVAQAVGAISVLGLMLFLSWWERRKERAHRWEEIGERRMRVHGAANLFAMLLITQIKNAQEGCAANDNAKVAQALFVVEDIAASMGRLDITDLPAVAAPAFVTIRGAAVEAAALVRNNPAPMRAHLISTLDNVARRVHEELGTLSKSDGGKGVLLRELAGHPSSTG